MPFTPSWLVNLFMQGLTAIIFVMACVSAFRQSRQGNRFSMRLSSLWAIGLGLWLLSPIYDRIFTIYHNGVGTVSNPLIYWLNALGFVCIVVAVGLSLRRPQIGA